MDRITALTFDCRPHGRNGTATVTVKSADDVLAVEKVDLSQSTQRAAFTETLCRQCRGIDRDEADRALLNMAAAVVAARTNADTSHDHQGNTTPTADELLAKMPEDVRDEAHTMLKSPDLVQQILDDIASLGVGLIADVFR